MVGTAARVRRERIYNVLILFVLVNGIYICIILYAPSRRRPVGWNKICVGERVCWWRAFYLKNSDISCNVRFSVSGRQ